ncbi:hypothetical protein HMI55_002679 [Coelomomyces lativittatus]|nr:hypothetical protein HMI55_002679 [Coelomomyces lativittatus]
MSGPQAGFSCSTEIRYKTCLVSLAAIWVGLIVTVIVLGITIPLGLYCYRRRSEITERLRSTGVERNLNSMASKFRAKYGRSDRKGWINI